MTGVISITTDFGHKGPFVAVMKAVILSRCPSASIVDFTHEIPVHWPPEAGFWLSRGYHYFPTGTVHIAVVDPGVGTEREILLASIHGHHFLAPDNGLLAPLLEAGGDAAVFRLDWLKVSTMLGLGKPSSTFHGRDIFAPIAAEICGGRLAVENCGTATNSWTPSQLDPPLTAAQRVSGTVITVDTFGNLITNIDAADIQHINDPVVRIGGHSYPLKLTYGQVVPGVYLALINSFNVVEIARSEGSATDGLGLERGAPVVVERATR